MIDGIVLAGGYSSRAKQNKMLLRIREKPIILTTVAALRSVCQKIIVVTGYYHDEIESLFKAEADVEVVRNENYAKGMFSSVLKGVAAVENNFLIIPGDIPFVGKDTLDKLVAGSKKIRVPSFEGHLGHPLYIDISFKSELLEQSYPDLKTFRNAHDFEIINVDDPNILFDIDTLNDYEKTKERF